MNLIFADVCFSSLDGSVQTVITFNQGGGWRPLQKPWNGVCDSTTEHPDKVRATHKQHSHNQIVILDINHAEHVD